MKNLDFTILRLGLFILTSLVVTSSSYSKASQNEIILNKGDSLTLKAESCPQGHRSAIAIRPKNVAESSIFYDVSGDLFFLKGVHQRGFRATNEVDISVKCIKVSCVLSRIGDGWWGDSYKVALELEDGVTIQYLAKSISTKSEAMNQLNTLIDNKVCTDFRKQKRGRGGWAEPIKAYQEGFPANIE